ncbi:hypothetical protein GCM10023084_32830 [Streptomyces lacrimifluminis]|uniref:Uncharacterized protein n=1 Tax=Streptomyces lacrimifluminis TaxID=1500077 RepID=A0A917KWW6_9ACTN|nr:hypothetical protein GCM10012282_30870 [Streptomyces lacrimifluminis]
MWLRRAGRFTPETGVVAVAVAVVLVTVLVMAAFVLFTRTIVPAACTLATALPKWAA